MSNIVDEQVAEYKATVKQMISESRFKAVK
jgi:hypothetical protein